MKFSVLVVLAALLSVFAAQFLFEDPGYVAISFRGYLIEMSVPAMMLIAASLLAGIWFAGKMIMAPRRLGEAAGRFRAGRAGERLTRGMIQVAEGNFARGENMLARSAGASDSPLFNYLQAARAAHLQGNDERRDEWLKLAYEQTPEANNAVLLTQAEFQLDRDQYGSERSAWDPSLYCAASLFCASARPCSAAFIFGLRTGSNLENYCRACRNTSKSSPRRLTNGQFVSTKSICDEPLTR